MSYHSDFLRRKNKRIRDAILIAETENNQLEEQMKNQLDTITEAENRLLDLAEKIIQIADVEKRAAQELADATEKCGILENQLLQEQIRKCIECKEMFDIRVNWTANICRISTYKLPLNNIDKVPYQILWCTFNILGKIIGHICNIIPDIDIGLRFVPGVTQEVQPKECFNIEKYGQHQFRVFYGDNLEKLASLVNHCIKIWIKWLGFAFKEEYTYLLYNIALFFQGVTQHPSNNNKYDIQPIHWENTRVQEAILSADNFMITESENRLFDLAEQIIQGK